MTATRLAPHSALPNTVIVLGLVSLLMDLSSEAIHALLPLFMVNALGLTAITIGLLDGAAEALSLALKPLAGRCSDRMQQRKPLTLAGYSLSMLAKPLFALAGGIGLVATARVLDRFGKGLRGAPRDALIADVTSPEQRGAAYGMRQALDTVGALLAPFVAVGLLWWLAGDYRAVFWLASLPALAAVLLVAFAVKEPAQHSASTTNAMRSAPSTTTTATATATATALPFPREFWWVMALGVLLTLARPGEAFLILRGQSLQLGDYLSALLLAAMNLSYALSVFPVGRHFDQVGPRKLLAVSLLLLACSQLLLSFASTVWMVFAGALLWGLHLGFCQGVLAALVARYAPAGRRATAFGWYALAIGVALLTNGAVFGALWQNLSPQYAFASTAALAILTGVVLSIGYTSFQYRTR